MTPTTSSCPVCFRPGASRTFSTRDRVHNLPGSFQLHRCAGCHALFIQPWLSYAELSAYYPENYGPYRHSRSLNNIRDRDRGRRFVLENYYGYPSRENRAPSSLKKTAAYLLSFVSAKDVIPYRGNGRFLDVGCGGGSFLYRMNQWGWETYGVEPSENGIQQASSLGLDVRHGMLPDANFPAKFFDVIRLSDVLEHLQDPKGTLLEIKRILKPDGRVYITVPNTRSFTFWLFRENWNALESPRHVISYCPRTLEVLCSMTGFEIVRIHFASGPFNFVRSVKLFFEAKGSAWPRQIRNIDWPRNKFIRRTLKPAFFAIDSLGFGDFLHATLRNEEDDTSN